MEIIKNAFGYLSLFRFGDTGFEIEISEFFEDNRDKEIR